MKATTARILSELARLDRGMSVTLPLSAELYSPQSLAATAATFKGFCDLEQASSQGASVVVLKLAPEHQSDARQVTGELLNFLLARSVQDMLVRDREQQG
jgi:hypothetical protein